MPLDPAEALDPARNFPPLLRAVVLAWTPRPRTWLIEVLRALEQRTPGGRYFGTVDVDEGLRALADAGFVRKDSAGWQPAEAHRLRLYRLALGLPDHAAWADAILARDGIRLDGLPAWINSRAPIVTAARLLFYGGANEARWAAFETSVRHHVDWNEIYDDLMLVRFDPELLERSDPVLASRFLSTTITHGVRGLDPRACAAFETAHRWIREGRPGGTLELRCGVAETLMMRGEPEAALARVAGIDGPPGTALRAAIAATEGRWEDAITGFESVLARLRKLTGQRRDLLPEAISWLYPMSLFATRDAARIASARKFCVTESGSRDPGPYEPWGPWVHAADIRLGDRPRDPGYLRPGDQWTGPVWLESVRRRMLQAWIHAGQQRGGGSGSSAPIRARLEACGFRWLLGQLDAADRVLDGKAPEVPFFATAGGDAWREALAAIAALDHTPANAGASGANAETQLVWLIDVAPNGRLRGITPNERKRGARGWGKPKAVPLSRLAKAVSLDPWDSRLARAIREQRGFGAKLLTLDIADAAPGLAGHPRVAFQDAPDRLLDIHDEPPEVRLVEENGAWRLEFVPDLAALTRPAKTAVGRKPGRGRTKRAVDLDDDELDAALDAAIGAIDDALDDGLDEEAAVEAMMRQIEGSQALPILVERTGESSARLIRMTPAHRRVVELAEAGLRVPSEALPELHAVLPVLSAHFRMKAGSAQEALRTDAETRLRAELSPLASGLRLRLVAAPLGPTGPRLAPGAGREDLFAPIDGRLRACERRLADERAALAAVLDAFPFLDPPADSDETPEWDVIETRDALALVERLGTLHAVAGIDWPKGRSVQVLQTASDRLRVKVAEDRGWFALSGGLRIDENEVVELSKLIELVGQHRSRYVPLDGDRWLALSDRLRQQVEDLAAVAERTRGGALRAPAPTAGWLEGALTDASVDGDGALARRLSALQASMAIEPAVPATLQAELRPYQRDGFVWLMQRAAAGFGACLADDMGLGKTLQSLAVLLARAEGGPALVVAPTSVCPNWIDEARRFAPSLRAQAWSQDLDMATLSPLDIVIVSYTMLQQNAERFAERDWATLVADEAQSIKNASAKRTQAVISVPAGFRVALSGTPIENRLGELWSIMGFVNPGLLGSAERFGQRFVRPIERDRDLRAQRTLRRLIAPFVLRRTKTQVLDDLPPRTEMTMTVKPGAREAAHYESLRREALAAAMQAIERSAPAQRQFHVLAQLTRLRRAACDPRLVNPELGIAGAKVEAFAELAAEIVANGHKALVFSQFVDFLGLLREAADGAGLRHQYLDGATPSAERARRIAAFQAGDGDLFLISLKAGGFGLNLTAADYVIIADPWWNPAAEDQASGRAHRIGQARPVTVYRLVTEGSIEERIAQLHRDKRALADGILEGGEAVAAPDTTELIALMRGD
ncbi:MAG: hypothetical protein RIS35_1954 [Pseudomonadota bacterium]